MPFVCQRVRMHVIVHGGAGSPPESPATRQKTLTDAADRQRRRRVRWARCWPRFGHLNRPSIQCRVGGAIQSDGEVRLALL